MQVPKTKDYHQLLKIAKSEKKQVATLKSSLNKIHNMYYIKDENFDNEVDDNPSQYTLDTLGRMTLQFVPQDSPKKIGPEQQKRIKLKRKKKREKKQLKALQEELLEVRQLEGMQLKGKPSTEKPLMKKPM